MKNNVYIGAILPFAALVLTGGMASAFTLTQYKASKPVEVGLPVTPDSLKNENSFSTEQLLESALPISLREQAQDWTTVTTDSAGKVELLPAASKPRLQSFVTNLRTPRFSKGSIKFHSNGMGNILVNGKSLAKKASVDTVSGEASAPIALNPEEDYEIQLNIVTMPQEEGTPSFRVEYVPEKEFEDVIPEADMSSTRRFSVRKTMTGNRIYRALLSPDGKYLLLKYAERHNDTDWTEYATLMETASKKVISENIDYSSDWMPTGSTLYRVEKHPDGNTMVTTQIPSLKSEIYAKHLPEKNFTVLPDGKTLIYYKRVEGKKDNGDMRRVLDPDDRIPGNRDRSYIMKYDIDTHISTPLTYGGKTTSIVDIDRKGTKLLYMSTENRPEEYPFYFNDLVQLDIATLATDTLIKNDPYITGAIYSPDAKQLFIKGSPSAFKGIGKNCGNHEIANDYDNQGYIMNIQTGVIKAVTKNFKPAVEDEPVWNPIDNKIYFIGEDGFFKNLYCLDPKTGAIQQLNKEKQTITRFSIGDQQDKWLAYVSGNFTETGKANLMSLKTLDSTVIDNPMSGELAGVEFGKMTPWTFTASDGTLIDGYECLPPNFDSSKKYPMIVYYYGGTSPSSAVMTHPYAPQVFASRDYVVYVLNPSGTTGYGQEFSARHVNTWGKRTAEDIIEGVKQFCKEHPYVDAKKVGCLGASYGGFMTEYLQTLTDIFAAAVSHAGISNVTSYWGEGFWGYSYNGVAAAKSYPWNNPDLFTKQGALFNADKIHTPLLLLHGTEDTNVPIGESIQLFNALKVLNREVEFITVQGENHVISNFDKKILWQNTIMAWFAKYLQDDPRWWNELYGK